MKDLKDKLGGAVEHNKDLERRILSSLRDRNIELGELDDVANRASTTMQRFGGNPVEWDKDPITAKVWEYAQFFGFVVDFLAGLKDSLEETLEQEGKQVGEFVATRLLSRLHHQDPSFPVDAIHEKISPPAARKEAEVAVAPHVAKVVEILKRQE